jgi:hypothetical protein
MTATISPCGQYRYDLWRHWNLDLPLIAWIMVNPSTATADTTDPTITRCVNFSTSWGFGRMVVGNLFALRSTDPAALKTHSAPIGPENDFYLDRIISDADLIVCAWGTHGKFRNRGDAVLRRIRAAGRVPHCLSRTKGGQPQHPLYLPSDLKAVPF